MSFRSVAAAAALALLAVAPAAGPAAAEDVAFEIINSTTVALAQFYTSPVDTNAWEEDVFGDGVLPPGNSVTVNIRDGREQCNYDMKFVMEDGRELVEPGIDICSMASYTINE